MKLKVLRLVGEAFEEITSWLTMKQWLALIIIVGLATAVMAPLVLG